MLRNEPIKKVSAIVDNEERLEKVIAALIAEAIARGDISVQGTAEQIKNKYGVAYVNPAIVQDSTYPPIQEPFLNDDFGWVLGFSFALPLFICLIVSIFIIGDIQSTHDNLWYGAIGAIVGTILGTILTQNVKRYRKSNLRKQEKQGGFVIWVIAHNAEQHQKVLTILKEHHLKRIKNWPIE
jgi:hypothetical protein